MKVKGLFLILALAHGGTVMCAFAKDKLIPDPTQWCHAAMGPVELHSKAGGGKKPVVTVPRGALLPVYESKRAGKGQWLRAVTVDPALLTQQTGWVDSAGVEVFDGSAFPVDDKILTQSGDAFIEDFAAENTAVARYLLRRKGDDPALVCYLGAEVLPHTRLQIIYWSQGKAKPGPHIEFTFSEMKSPITRLEVRDLAGDGDEFLITHEPYSAGPMNSGVNMVVRRLAGNELKVLWKTPIAAKNLASYPAKREILEPAELNIGRPGTDTKGEVEFRARGTLTDIVWKGEINIHALGREKPVETLSVEKVWRWDGAHFIPAP